MKALIWKELRENLKWAVLPVLLTVGLYALGGTPNQTKILKADVLLVQSLVAAVFGAAAHHQQVARLGDDISGVTHRVPFFGGCGLDFGDSVAVDDRAHCIPVHIRSRLHNGGHQLLHVRDWPVRRRRCTAAR